MPSSPNLNEAPRATASWLRSFPSYGCDAYAPKPNRLKRPLRTLLDLNLLVVTIYMWRRSGKRFVNYRRVWKNFDLWKALIRKMALEDDGGVKNGLGGLLLIARLEIVCADVAEGIICANAAKLNQIIAEKPGGRRLPDHRPFTIRAYFSFERITRQDLGVLVV